MNVNMVKVTPNQQQLDGSASPDGDGDNGDHNNLVVMPASLSLSGTAAVIKNIKSINMLPPKLMRPAADSSLHDNMLTPVRSDIVFDTTRPCWDEEITDSSPTPFDGDYDNFEDDSLKPRQLEQTFAADDDASDSDSGTNSIFSPIFNDVAADYNYEDPDEELHSLVTIKPSERDERSLPEDTFSFLIYSRYLPPSLTFLMATSVFLFQIAIYSVLAYNICDMMNDRRNPLNLPVKVDKSVMVAEFLAMAVAIITQDEVRNAVNLYRDGFDQDVLSKAFEGATKAKWILSIELRFVEGLFGLILTFLLIMQSATVLDLLLNFLAMEFVSKLDDAVFALAMQGFFGKILQEEAEKVSNTSYRNRSSRSSAYGFYFGMAYGIFLFVCFVIAWTVIVIYQKQGKYLCQTIFAQFGDDVVPMLGTFSGIFHLQKNMTFDRRLSYTNDQVGGVLLAYCQNETRWTLSNNPEPEPCKWTAASPVSQSYDAMTTADSQWVVKTPANGVVPLSQHFLACYDCKYDDNFCGDSGECIKEKNTCKCHSGYGLRCEYPDPCQILETETVQVQHGLDEKGIAKTGESYFASNYYRLKDDFHHRPIYTSLGDDQTLSNDNPNPTFFVFTGVRWIMTSYKRLFPLEFPELMNVNVTNMDSLVDEEYDFSKKMLQRFQQGNFTVTAFLVSEAVHINTPVDVDASPAVNVRWRYSTAVKDQRLQPQPDLQKGFIETSFFCAVCNESTKPCSYGATCLENGTCGECPHGSTGTLCQIPPTSNGKCNPFFNTATYKWDGGDCCENTCKSTPENTCGKADDRYIDTGYPSCAESMPNQWELSGDSIPGESSASRSGHAVALSGKGTILAVADGTSVVRLFDKDGLEWNKRGQVQGPSESNFGSAISLSDESYNIARNPRTYPTVTLAVGAPKNGLVRVYTCSTNKMESGDRVGCIQRGEDIVGSGRFGSSLSISKDGNSIAIGGADRESINAENNIVGDVQVFTWNTTSWQQKGNVTLATLWPTKLAEASSIPSSSSAPSASPSVEPTLTPNTSPSSNSTALPLLHPSVSPSSQATSRFSAPPSSTPTDESFASPSSHPTGQPSAASYQFGLQAYYVSLSGDYLAVGTLEGDVTPVPRFEAVNLITQVYKWDNSNGTGWNTLGDGIKLKFFDDAGFGDPWPLKPLVIKGHTLAIGHAIDSNSSFSVYEWNETLAAWEQRKINITETEQRKINIKETEQRRINITEIEQRKIEPEDSSLNGLAGWSIDMSDDSNILAVGASVETPQPTDESIRMYKWNDNDKLYEQLFNGVPGGPSASVALSSDGKAVAVGLPFDSSNRGSVSVYSYHPSSPCEGPSEIPLRISFTTDGRPEESSWKLLIGSQEGKRTSTSGSLSGYMYTTFVEEMCIPETSCVNFVVYDTQGNGLEPPGVFALMLNGIEVAKGGKFEDVTCISSCIPQKDQTWDDVTKVGNAIGDCEYTNEVNHK